MNFQIRHLLLAVALILATFGAAFAQSAKPIKVVGDSPTCLTRSHSFESGEELVYVAEFSRLLLKKMDIADFRFSAGRLDSANQSKGSGEPSSATSDHSLKLTGDISSKGFFSKLFNLTFQRTRRVDRGSNILHRSKNQED